MNELIRLTPTEQFLANTDMTITLKEIADKYNKRHNDLKSVFNLAVSKLSEENLGYVSVVPKKIEIKTGKGRVETINTFALDIRTMLWLITKFDHNLRFHVVNYAFEKLEKEKLIALKEAKKPIVYPDGNTSVGRCISEAWEDHDEDIQTHIPLKLVSFCQKNIETELHNRFKDKKINGEYFRLSDDDISELVEEFDRLVEEFELVAKYYRKKLNEERTK